METRAPTEGGDELLLRWHKLRDSFAAATPLIQNLVDHRGAPAAADNMVYMQVINAVERAMRHSADIKSKLEGPRFSPQTEGGTQLERTMYNGAKEQYDSVFQTFLGKMRANKQQQPQEGTIEGAAAAAAAAKPASISAPATATVSAPSAATVTITAIAARHTLLIPSASRAAAAGIMDEPPTAGINKKRPRDEFGGDPGAMGDVMDGGDAGGDGGATAGIAAPLPVFLLTHIAPPITAVPAAARSLVATVTKRIKCPGCKVKQTRQLRADELMFKCEACKKKLSTPLSWFS
mmetsp:Transcript_28052/g.70487  ORF Transcript_28052/g.70487 Transcript_28052/m.70487 type:complete len:292 (-) Transcript_28052:246-1121(-)